MENSNNTKLIFDFPGEIDVVDVADEVLNRYGLTENVEEYLRIFENDEDPKEVTLVSAAKILVQKKVPEEKVIELLGKHLKTTPDISRKVVNDLKEKIVPYAKLIDVKKMEEELAEEAKKRLESRVLQEELVEKIEGRTSLEELKEGEKTNPSVKKIDTKNVEENAEKIQVQKKFGQEEKNMILEEEKLKKEREEVLKNKPQRSDTYREPVG